MTASVLITGAGTGIGIDTALYLSERGYRVYASVPDLSQREWVEERAAAHGVEVRVLHLDVTQPETIQAAVDTVVAECGTIYGLVNNAGLGLRGFFEDLSEAEIRRLFDVNVFGAMAVTRAVLPSMRAARRGRIVMISSAGGRIATMTISAYASGKFALEGFGESLAMEIAPFGLQVSMIEPGLVMTPHFTTNRGQASAAIDSRSVYYDWFTRHERAIDTILKVHHITPVDVAKGVHRALTAKRPRLRYAIGTRVKIVFALKRYLPNTWFERMYSRQVHRMAGSDVATFERH